MNAAFNPETFLDVTFTEATATAFEPITPGEYPAVIEDVKLANGIGKESGKPWVRIEVTWTIEDEALRERLGRKKLVSRQSVMLDLDADGNPAKGKGININLGLLRDALDLNRPGEAFTIRMLTGRRAKVRIDNREYNGKVYDEVKGVSRL